MEKNLKFKSVLVTGGNGQLGTSLKQILNETATDSSIFHFTDIDTLDITDKAAIEKFCDEHSVDAIVNLAAYTNVDKAESDREAAYTLNASAVKNLAEAARQRNCFLIQISTDYVFDGKSRQPYKPEDAVAPISVYGASKAEGERHVINTAPHAAIIRTAWLYSAYGKNFFKTMLRLGAEKDEISVVNDQTGCPTYAPDLAKAILTVLQQTDKIRKVEIFHFTNEGAITWYDFASEIMKMSESRCKVNPIASAAYPTPVSRPKYSVFDLSKIKDRFGIIIPDWKESLKLCYKTYMAL